MWTNHLFRHKNLFLVVCGDQSTVISYRRQSVGRHGNFVSEVMQDYPRAADSDDCIRLFRFLPKERRIRVYAYSPTLGGIPKVAAFKTEWADHCFELPFPEPLD